jgi:putative hemolysin
MNAFFDTQFALGRLPYFLRLKKLQIIRPFVEIEFENSAYQVKTVNDPEELLEVLRLRFEVFFQEFSSRKLTGRFFPYDVDMHDFFCDHLIVKDKTTNKIVACYRLLHSSFEDRIKGYYSEGEFRIDDFLQKPGVKLELGRACVHKDYRSGSVIGLLWRGLCDYAKKAHVDYLFGCTSLTRSFFEKLPQVLRYLQDKDAFIDDFYVGIRPKYRIESHLHLELDLVPAQTAENLSKALPSLMNMYLMAGAKVSRQLAYDKEMDCLDIFTILEFKKLPPAFERRFVP